MMFDLRKSLDRQTDRQASFLSYFRVNFEVDKGTYRYW